MKKKNQSLHSYILPLAIHALCINYFPIITRLASQLECAGAESLVNGTKWHNSSSRYFRLEIETRTKKVLNSVKQWLLCSGRSTIRCRSEPVPTGRVLRVPEQWI